MNLSKKNTIPDVSVITVNYKGYKDTCEFIHSWLTTIKSVSYELIIVDNASPTGDISLLKKQFPEIDYPMLTFIESKENKGFAGGNNLGIEIAKGRFLFFLNNDVLLVEDTLENYLKRLERSDKIAAFSPLLLNYDKEQSIQFAGYTPLSTITLRNCALGVGSTNRDAFPARQTPYLHGAAMLIKRSVIDRVGYMPEFYFLYYEELDWCTQIRASGYELWFDPSFKVIHKESSSTGKESALKCYYLTRNRLIYTSRHRKGINKSLALIYQIIIVGSRNLITTYLRGEKEKRDAYYRALNDFFTYLNMKKND